MTNPTRNPLSWPVGWPRCAVHRAAPFRKAGRYDLTIADAIDRLEKELQRLGATDTLLSSNLKLSLAGVPYSGQGEPKDRGIAIYFRLKGKDRVLACDSYLSCAGNIAGIAAHIDALRRIERYGVGSIEQAFAGYVGLPPPGADNRAPWRASLQFEPNDHVTVAIMQARYRNLAKQHATDDAVLLDLNLAREAALHELMSGGLQ